MKKKSKSSVATDLNRVTNYIYEMGIHMHTPRSGLWLLGSGEQSVAEHLFRVAMIAYSLCHFEPTADKNKVILMALVHDIGEGRVSDLNYVHQRYGRLIEKQAVQDIAMSVPFGKEIENLYLEEQERVTLEAKLVKDADQLEWIATLRAEEEKGNAKARGWAETAIKRLKTDIAIKLAKKLMQVHPDAWWHDGNDSWFVDRNPKDQKWNVK